MKKALWLTICAIVLWTSAFADYYIKTKTHTDETQMMGQKYPSRDEISEQWIGLNRIQHSTKAQTIIINQKTQKIFIIYHKEKTYVETDFPLDMSKIMTEQQIAMLKMWKITVAVTPSNETKKVNQWNCSGYDVTSNVGMMTMKAKYWAAANVPFDPIQYQQTIFPALFQVTMAQKADDSVLNELKKIKGFIIQQEITFLMGESTFKMTAFVEEITEKPSSESIYSIPSGYRKVDAISFNNWSS